MFGVSDGLVSNVALILGVAGASSQASLVRVAGLSGLLAGAVSMAAGEYVSVKAQNELIDREVEIERRSILEMPEAETNELQAIYEARGLGPEHARRVAIAFMSDPVVALDVHAREELGLSPDALASAWLASGSSFAAFAVGATLVGLLLARFTERSRWRTISRQVAVAAFSCGVTFLLGNLFGSGVG